MNSLFSRISVSFIGSVTVAVISFFTSIFLARTLGSSDFGLYQYMLSIGQSIIMISGLNAGNAYFTYISKDTYQVSYHLVFASVQIFLACIAVFIAVFFMGKYLFESMELKFILTCICGSFAFYFLRQQSIYLLESLRRNSTLQFFLVLTAVINLMILVVISLRSNLAISDIFLVMAVTHLILWIVAIYLSNSTDSSYRKKLIWSQQMNSYITYIKPLIFSLFVVQIGMLFDRWLLQTNSGSVEQAYFGVAIRIATIATIVSASTVNIFWKEISSLLRENKRASAIDLLIRWHDRVVTIVFFGCLFIFVNAEQLIILSYGDNYLESVNALKIMSFYPLLQTSVHLLSAFLYSEESSADVAKASIITSIFGGVLIWLLFISNFGIPGSVILSVKFILVSIFLIFLLGSSLEISRKLWSIRKHLIILPAIFFLNLYFNNFLSSYNLQAISHLLISGFFISAIYLIMLLKKRHA